jgi:hypothetical protein
MGGGLGEWIYLTTSRSPSLLARKKMEDAENYFSLYSRSQIAKGILYIRPSKNG